MAIGEGGDLIQCIESRYPYCSTVICALVLLIPDFDWELRSHFSISLQSFLLPPATGSELVVLFSGAALVCYSLEILNRFLNFSLESVEVDLRTAT